MKNQRKPDFYKFSKLIIEKNGNVSTTDAENCGISFPIWFELATRVSEIQLVENARKVVEHYEKKNI